MSGSSSPELKDVEEKNEDGGDHVETKKKKGETFLQFQRKKKRSTRVKRQLANDDNGDNNNDRKNKRCGSACVDSGSSTDLLRVPERHVEGTKVGWRMLTREELIKFHLKPSLSKHKVPNLATVALDKKSGDSKDEEKKTKIDDGDKSGGYDTSVEKEEESSTSHQKDDETDSSSSSRDNKTFKTCKECKRKLCILVHFSIDKRYPFKASRSFCKTCRSKKLREERKNAKGLTAQEEEIAAKEKKERDTLFKMGMKKCLGECKHTLLLSMFSKQGNGYRTECKPCRRVKSKQKYYAKKLIKTQGTDKKEEEEEPLLDEDQRKCISCHIIKNLATDFHLYSHPTGKRPRTICKSCVNKKSRSMTLKIRGKTEDDVIKEVNETKALFAQGKKKCTKCGSIGKIGVEFRPVTDTKDGFYPSCRKCCRTHVVTAKEWRVQYYKSQGECCAICKIIVPFTAVEFAHFSREIKLRNANGKPICFSSITNIEKLKKECTKGRFFCHPHHLIETINESKQSQIQTRIAQNNRKRLQERQKYTDDEKRRRGACMDCGIRIGAMLPDGLIIPLRFWEFDHRDRESKTISVTDLRGRKFEEIEPLLIKTLEECDLRCRACHRERTQKLKHFLRKTKSQLPSSVPPDDSV